VSREAKFVLFIKPEVGAVVHTVGTVTVLTRVISIVGLVTILADIDLSTESLGASMLDVIHSFPIRGEHGIAKLSAVLGAKASEDIGKFKHGNLLIDLA
jgi:hypothetical protein